MHLEQGKRKVQMISAVFLLLLLFSFMGPIQEQIVGMSIPMLIYTDKREADGSLADYVVKQVFQSIPLYLYTEKEMKYTAIIEDESTYDLIMKMEGMDEDIGQLDNIEAAEAEQNLEDAFRAENESAKYEGVETENQVFTKAIEKKNNYQIEDIKDFKSLVTQFYAIDSTTMIDEKQLNAEKMLSKDMKIKGDASKPQILIYHTHASEGFVDSIAGDTSTTVIGAGEKLAGLLREEYGYNVIHDTGQYDAVRAQAYTVAAPAVEQILADNPSIEVIIDLHRDQMREGMKLVTELDGRPTAKFMFFNGLSRTKERGDIDYLYNPYIDDNLALAFQMQLACNEYYPGITRRIYLKGYRYNMQYRDKTLLIELGAQTNTVEEIMNAIDPIAHALHIVLSGEES